MYWSAWLMILLSLSCGQRTKFQQSLEWSQTMNIEVGRAPGSIEVADFNNDKIPDVAVTSESDSSVTVLLGQGNGEFTQAPGSPFFTGNAPNDMAIGDFNKDGNLDLAFANHDRKYLTVLLGNGQGGFASAAGSPFPVEVIPHTHGLATGDFNNDGRLDLVTDSWGNNEVEVLFGDSIKLFRTPGTFFKVGNHPYQRVRVADVNGDGNIDIVTTNLDGDNATILLGDGKGAFNEAPGSPVPCGDSPFGLAIGDVNGDGKRDLAIINSPASTSDRRGTNGLTILLGDGAGKFAMMKGCPFYSGSIPNRIAIGDLNGDGINDIAVSDNGTDKVYLFIMSRNGVASQLSVTVGSHPKGVALADVNGDGKADILVCNNSDNDISIILSK
jgi:hypothetical protein